MYTNRRNSVCAAALALTCLAAPASANEVFLRSTDGSIDVKGKLIEFTDGMYVISSQLGVFRFGADRVRCEGDACPQIDTDDAQFTIAGSEIVGEELMPLILAGFAASLGAEADVEVGSDQFAKRIALVDDEGFGEEFTSFQIVSNSSDRGLEKLRQGSAHLAMTSRPVSRRESSSFSEAGLGTISDLDQERVVAVDSVRVIVSPSNPVSTISIEDLARIYSGAVTNWSELGGPNAPITVYTRAEGTGTRTLIERNVLRSIRADHTTNAVVLAGNVEMANAVASDPYGIGLVGFAFERGAKTLALADSCGFSTLPDEFSSKTEEYPLERRLYIYNRGGDNPDVVKGLLDYVSSENVDGLVAKAGFVDLGIKRRPQTVIAERVREALASTNDPFETDLMNRLYADLDKWDRLSTTFRFATGSSSLDNKAKRDLERLRNYLELNPGSSLAVVGFTDSDGAAAGNQRLAERRAARVAAELRAVAGDILPEDRLLVKGYGELAPAACNQTFQGKTINRRVEIWVSRTS